MYNPHPIQISTIIVKELSIKAIRLQSQYAFGETDEEHALEVGVKTGEYKPDRRTIEVLIKAETPSDTKDNPYKLKVEIMGVFKVDTQRFDVSQIEHWARWNAPFILFPYLREHIYSLTLRCGYKPGIMPLMEVPTFQPKTLPAQTIKTQIGQRVAARKVAAKKRKSK